VGLFNILVLVVVVLLIPTAYAGKIGAPYAPTFNPAIKQGFKHIKLGNEDTLVDLGAGDGRVMLQALDLGANAIGYELSPIMWFITWFRLKFSPPARGGARGGGRIYMRNFYKQKLPPQSTVIFAFLMPQNMHKIKELLLKQHFPHGKYFLAYAFPLPDVAPLKVVKANKCAPLYVYNLQSLTKS